MAARCRCLCAGSRAIQPNSERASRVSTGVNTAGAVVGTFIAGFLFLPTLGLRQTLGVAVALNLLPGALALRLSRHEPVTMPVAGALSRITLQLHPPILPDFSAFVLHRRATAMAYEIGWTRLLSTQLGSSTYAFTLMLATFLTGIVLGSAIFERWNRHYEVSRMTFAFTQISRHSPRWLS